ncbi:hypothetical protein Purlil1_10812 [Purpureocillium lilacinum]|nr:hypothetical protein Purlil1_10812 [Purpureocillium lilacinum]
MLLAKLGDGRSVGTAGVAWTARARERASQAPGEAKQDPSDAPTSNHGDGLDSGGRVQADVEWDDGFQAAHEMEAPAPIGSGCRDKRGSVVWIGILRWLGMDPRPLKMVPLNSKGQGKGKGKGTCTRRLSPGGLIGPVVDGNKMLLVRAQNHGHPEPPCLASAPFRHGAGGRAAAAAALADSSHEVRTGLNVIDQLWSPYMRLVPVLVLRSFPLSPRGKDTGADLAREEEPTAGPTTSEFSCAPPVPSPRPASAGDARVPVRYDPVASAETARPDAHP